MVQVVIQPFIKRFWLRRFYATEPSVLLEGVTTPVNDYTPIVKYVSDPNILVVSKTLGVSDFD